MGSFFLLIIDAYSKWPEIIRTSSTTTIQTIKILNTIFARFGPPEVIASDNGVQFTAEKFNCFCLSNGIEHIRSNPYHPMSNGQAERFVDTFKRSMTKSKTEGDIDENSENFLLNYRITPNPNCPSNVSPAEVIFGRKIRTTFDLLKPSVKHPIKHNIQMENEFNSKHGAKRRNFEIDDKVWIQIHKNNSWIWEERIILEKTGNVNYRVLTRNREIRAHTNQLRNRYDSSPPNPHDSTLDISSDSD